MPTQKEHHEAHSSATNTVRDIVIGMSDGLTVPFALAAGLTGAVAVSHIITTAGLAEIIAGSISMGLGGYLAAQGDAEHYFSERKREEQEVKDTPNIEEQEVVDSLAEYGITRADAEPMLLVLRNNPKAWVDFMMRNELGLEKPDPKRAYVSAATIAGSYVIGGAVPLSPYFFIHNAREALVPSVIVTLIALALFGFFKGRANGVSPWRSATQTVVIGGIAAGAAFFLASKFSS